ncbi:MAG: adenylyltransferase/cytidyltransferase family protein [Candidatus Peregrinibacteria bacterium]
MRALVFGTFDRLHPGHRHFLEKALTFGELWIVVARDRTVKTIKGKMPMQSEEERRRAVAQAFPSAHVILGDENDYLAPVRAVQPDRILLGYDQSLPPGVDERDLPCPAERLTPFEPERWKSSKLRT